MGTMLIIGMGAKPKKDKEMTNPMEKYMSKASDEKPEKDALVEDESADESTGGKIAFSMPAGFKVPDGVKDGEPFDAMATLKVQGGKLVLSELDGTPVNDEAEEGEEEPTEEKEGEESPDQMAGNKEDEGSGGDLGFLDAIEKKASKNKM